MHTGDILECLISKFPIMMMLSLDHFTNDETGKCSLPHSALTNCLLKPTAFPQKAKVLPPELLTNR